MVRRDKDVYAIIALLKEHEETIYQLLEKERKHLNFCCYRYKQESEYNRYIEHNRVYNLIKLLLKMDPDKLNDRPTFDDTRTF